MTCHGRASRALPVIPSCLTLCLDGVCVYVCVLGLGPACEGKTTSAELCLVHKRKVSYLQKELKVGCDCKMFFTKLFTSEIFAFIVKWLRNFSIDLSAVLRVGLF